MLELRENRYGKSRVRLMKVLHNAERHQVLDWTVEVWLEGDFTACFLDGDNSLILPTDTMKNTVYSLARSSSSETMEEFATELVTYFLANNPQIDSAGASIKGNRWQGIEIDGAPHSTSFQNARIEKETATVTKSRNAGCRIISGVEGVAILKTANSAFSGFLKDEFTTLRETEDRLLGTLMQAHWTYSESALDFDAARGKVRSALLRAFAEHSSRSVQQTLYAMAEAALDSVSQISEIQLSMPNRHCNLVDLSPFGQDNPNMIFVPTDEPHGSIEARIRRSE